LQFLRDGGRMAIVLPDGIYGNETLGYIRNWLLDKARIVAIIDVPIETFMPNTSTKTSIMILQKLQKEKIPEDYPIFMAVAETCGHDRRGKEKEDDDIKKIAEEFKKWAEKHNFKLK
jgi:type I restriction enzyme M protein